MKSCPSRTSTIGTNSWPGRIDRLSMLAPSRSTSRPNSSPPTARAISDARSSTGDDRTADLGGRSSLGPVEQVGPPVVIDLHQLDRRAPHLEHRDEHAR